MSRLYPRAWATVFRGGTLFILVVFFFPEGVLGTARDALARRQPCPR
ncbi:MAG: hypothetical protein HY002_03070 [Candidatus Rokubacteria bacterium]|nr:hypothetical protein [Candidatus Rokubacteria bacterium]